MDRERTWICYKCRATVPDWIDECSCGIKRPYGIYVESAQPDVEPSQFAGCDATYAGPLLQDEPEQCIDRERLEISLRNVRAFAVRALRKGTMTQTDCNTLLRFCKEAGIEARILRGDDDCDDYRRRGRIMQNVIAAFDAAREELELMVYEFSAKASGD